MHHTHVGTARGEGGDALRRDALRPCEVRQGRTVRWVEPLDVPDGDGEAACCREGAQPVAFSRCGRHGLLDEDVPTAQHGSCGQVGVEGCRRSDDHRIHRVEQGVVGGEGRDGSARGHPRAGGCIRVKKPCGCSEFFQAFQVDRAQMPDPANPHVHHAGKLRARLYLPLRDDPR